jgi:hypothetical protein
VADLPSILSGVVKGEGLLKAIYDDLASPGVRQVGRALEAVFQTGNIVLLPLRMLNETVAQFERRSFNEIAARFKDIPEEDLVEVRPEIGNPVIDRLSITSDPDLRKLFIELLASAANRKAVDSAHPSFVKIIESLSPDEAKMLSEWKGKHLIPCLLIGYKAEQEGSRSIYDPFIELPDCVQNPNLASIYVANLHGLGLVIHHRDSHTTTQGAYDTLIDGIKRDIPLIKEERIIVFGDKENRPKIGDHFYQKGCVELTPYGKAFQKACIQ